MTADLKDCLSGEDGLPREKWRRFDNSFDAFAQAREEAEKAEKEAAKPRFAKAEIHIAVVGAQTRIGTTTFALRLAEYFRSRDSQSVVVCASKRGISQLEMIKDSFDSTMNTHGICTIGNGIDICSTSADPQKKYNVEVYDFGNTSTSAIKFDDFDKIYLIGGTSWSELPMIYAAQQPLNSINYTVAVNFSTDGKIEKCCEALAVNLNDIINLPLEADPLEIGSYENILDNEFQQWADKTAEIQLKTMKKTRCINVMKQLKLHYRIDYGEMKSVKSHHSTDKAQQGSASSCPVVVYKSDSIENTLQTLFGKSLAKYNAKQTRSDRKKKLSEIVCSDAKTKAFREVSIWFYPTSDTSPDYHFELAKTILEKYFQNFEERNPNLKIFAAEMKYQNMPHLYIDFIPICHKKQRGMDTRISFKGALAEQGFHSLNRRCTEQILWVQSEKQYLMNLMRNTL